MVFFGGTQTLSMHLRLPKAVRDVPISCRARVPSGSSKAKEIDEICPSEKVLGFLIQAGSCLMIKDEYVGLCVESSSCSASGE